MPCCFLFLFLSEDAAGTFMLLAHGCRILTQRFLLCRSHVFRDGNIHRNELVASPASPQIGDTLAAQ